MDGSRRLQAVGPDHGRGAQASFSETFNIVAADAVSVNVPVVTSKKVAWTAQAFHADPTDSDDIAGHLLAAYQVKGVAPAHNVNLQGLRAYNHASRLGWLSYLGG